MKTMQVYENQDAVFQRTLIQIFNIGTWDTLTTMKNEEDWEFYRKQIQDVLSCNMAGQDMVTVRRGGLKLSREEEGK